MVAVLSFGADLHAVLLGRMAEVRDAEPVR